MKLYLLRHGQSEANVNENRYLDVPERDLELTKLGRRQAKEAGDEWRSILKNEKVNIILSPSLRTHQTFDHFKAGLEINNDRVVISFLTDEHRYGIYESGDKELLRLKLIEDEKMYSYKFPSGESREDVRERARIFLEGLDTSRDHFIFGHHEFFRQLITLINLKERDVNIEEHYSFRTSNCELLTFDL